MNAWNRHPIYWSTAKTSNNAMSRNSSNLEFFTVIHICFITTPCEFEFDLMFHIIPNERRARINFNLEGYGLRKNRSLHYYFLPCTSLSDR